MNGGDGITNIKLCIVEIGEILDLMDKTDLEIGYEITMESCYSGKACHAAKQWIEKNPNYYFKYVLIHASTYMSNKGIWGRYRRFKRKTIVSG